jgi:hypothetical protein
VRIGRRSNGWAPATCASVNPIANSDARTDVRMAVCTRLADQSVDRQIAVRGSICRMWAESNGQPLSGIEPRAALEPWFCAISVSQPSIDHDGVPSNC